MRDLPSCLLIAVLSISPVAAQGPGKPIDPVQIARPSAWKAREVGVGVVLRQRWFAHLFTGPQSITVLELDGANEAIDFDVEAPGKLEKTSNMAGRRGALCAINGGFFTPDAKPHGLLRLDGKLLSAATARQGCIGVLTNGDLRLQQREAGDWPEVHEALGAGVVLVRDGKVVDHGEQQREIRHPRSAVGTTKDGRILLVAIDGRTDKATGTSYEETAQVLIALGCDFAINLDGGGSTTIWVQGLGVCNFPCDNKVHDHAGERRIANALLVHAPAVIEVDDGDARFPGGGFAIVRDGEGIRGEECARWEGGDGAGRAVFAARLPFAGRWRARIWMPRVKGSEHAFRAGVAVGDKRPTLDGTPTTAKAGAWTDLDTFDLKEPGRVAVHVTSARGAPFVVDAVQFVQERAR